jgi:hypothetical protein
MAGLPDLMQTSAPVPQARGGVASYTPQQNQVGQIMRGTAGELSDAANIVAATNDRQDAIVAQAAANNLQAARTAAEFDPEQGFRAAKEGAAVGQSFIKDYTQKFTDTQTLLRTGLENDNQRRIFDQHAQVQGLQYKAALMQHQAQQTEAFNKTTADAKLNLSLDSMARRPTDELNFQTEMAAINGVIEDSGKRNGLPAEVVSQLKTQYLSKAYGQRIVSLMQGIPGISTPDPFAAAKMFKDVEGDLSHAEIGKLAPALTESLKLTTNSAIAQSEGAALADRFDYTHTADAIKVIDGMTYTPEQKTAIRAEVEHRHAIQQSDADKGNALVVGKVSEMVYSGMSRARITASPEFQQARDKGAILKMIDDKAYTDVLRANAVDAQGIARLQRHQTELHIGQASNAMAYADPTVLAGTSRENIQAMVPTLGIEWTHELLAKKDALEKTGNLKQATMDYDDIKAVAKDFFGIEVNNLKTAEQKDAFMRFKSRAESLIAADPNGRQMTREEKYSRLAAEASRTVTTDPGVFSFNKQTPLLAIDPKTVDKVVVPKADAFRIGELMRKQYQATGNMDFAPTDANLRRWYLVDKGEKPGSVFAPRVKP